MHDLLQLKLRHQLFFLCVVENDSITKQVICMVLVRRVFFKFTTILFAVIDSKHQPKYTKNSTVYLKSTWLTVPTYWFTNPPFGICPGAIYFDPPKVRESPQDDLPRPQDPQAQWPNSNGLLLHLDRLTTTTTAPTRGEGRHRLMLCNHQGRSSATCSRGMM